MKKDKEWLKAEIESILYGIKFIGQVAVTSEGSSIYYAIEEKIDELYEPEVKQLDKKIKELDSYNDELIRDNNQLRNTLDNQEILSQKWVDENVVEGDFRGGGQFWYGRFIEEEKVRNLLVPKQDKPVIPQFVADWIETHNLYGNNPLREYRDLEIDFNEGWTNEEDATVYDWVNKNPYAFIDALRYGYEVEKEKKYRVRAGNRYIRFNLDGSIIGVKKDNSIVCLERLSKLPFDYKKAVESGIITLEEVIE